MTARMTINGAILSGGESRRMGHDKALLYLDGKTLLQHVLDALSAATDDQVIVSGHEAHQLPHVNRIADIVPKCGPAGGILTALTWSSSDWTVILSCDTPKVKSSTIQALIERSQISTKDAVILSHDGHLMPLIGIYHTRCATAFQSAINDQEYRVQTILKLLEYDVHLLDDESSNEVLNINRLEDINTFYNES